MRSNNNDQPSRPLRPFLTTHSTPLGAGTWMRTPRKMVQTNRRILRSGLRFPGIRIFRLKHGLSRQTYNIRLGWKRNRMKNHKSQFGVESGPFLPNIEGSGLCFQPTLEYNYEWCSQGFNLRLRNEFFLLIQKSGTFNLIFRIAGICIVAFRWVLGIFGVVFVSLC